MGRTLPNMFAFLPVNVALALLIDKKPATLNPSNKSMATAIALLTFTTAVFRAEVALFLGPIALQALLFGHITFRRLILVGLISGLLSIGKSFTVAIDSYFWGKGFVWPEFAGIYFNVYEGKSAEWGVSPIHTYWTSFLPKLLLSSLPLSLVGFLQDQRLRILLLPSLLFIGLISCLGHKEWRFIVYVVPIFNIVAAGGARYLISVFKRTTTGKVFAFSLMPVFIGLNLALTFIFTLSSMYNYPGGDSLALLHQIYPQHQYPSAHVHISNLAAQTGASLFLQINAPPFPYAHHPHLLSTSWVYNKTEHLTLADLTANPAITHLIVETAPTEDTQRNWEVAAAVKGFERWSIDRDLLLTLWKEKTGWERLAGMAKMANREQLWILHRKPSN
ncbi:hypothetical protein H0H92_005679 [Tricholoma furcatifolium]|nr:hypothetical protein H0H92_005679 [Tricholoma furcatifolium]